MDQTPTPQEPTADPPKARQPSAKGRRGKPAAGKTTKKKAKATSTKKTSAKKKTADSSPVAKRKSSPASPTCAPEQAPDPSPDPVLTAAAPPDADQPAGAPDAEAKQEKDPPGPEPLRSVHTPNFRQILAEGRISLFVTTYQAGRLVIFRADHETLNTHFRNFVNPMGLAIDRNRMAIGAGMNLWEFHNAPEVGRRLEPAGRHDACYLPRSCHVTGNIFVHEMAWAGDELWFVNTRFSCLCTRDVLHSFVPRWRPPFVSALAPEDRCHLNGLAMVDGQPRYVTALGRSDEMKGWRPDKATGGIVMEVPSGEILAEGLSMPHSPRWYDGRLWVLDSGSGGVGTVDLSTGSYQSIAELPGFTRGLDFHGPLAFVGLSQVRETAVFSGIPITERDTPRTCGVWVLDIRNGQTVAFLRFEEAVQEIFAVAVVPGVQFPELINDDHRLLADSFVLPEQSMDDVIPSIRYPVRQ